MAFSWGSHVILVLHFSYIACNIFISLQFQKHEPFYNLTNVSKLILKGVYQDNSTVLVFNSIRGCGGRGWWKAEYIYLFLCVFHWHITGLLTRNESKSLISFVISFIALRNGIHSFRLDSTVCWLYRTVPLIHIQI